MEGVAAWILLQEHNVHRAITAVTFRSKADAGRVDSDKNIQIIRPGCVFRCDLKGSSAFECIEKTLIC